MHEEEKTFARPLMRFFFFARQDSKEAEPHVSHPLMLAEKREAAIVESLLNPGTGFDE